MCQNIVGTSCNPTIFISSFNKSPYWDNPGGGNSEIVSITNTTIFYKRKSSKMGIPIDLINKIYNHIVSDNLIGKKISVKDLKMIIDIVCPNYKGWNNCDGTFIMMIFRYFVNAKIVGKRPCCVIL